MRSITVRDLRQRWPRAEALLLVEKEILVTRDARPVAKLVRVQPEPKRRKRFDPRKHAAWQERMNRGRTVRWVDEFLSADRNAR